MGAQRGTEDVDSIDGGATPVRRLGRGFGLESRERPPLGADSGVFVGRPECADRWAGELQGRCGGPVDGRRRPESVPTWPPPSPGPPLQETPLSVLGFDVSAPNPRSASPGPVLTAGTVGGAHLPEPTRGVVPAPVAPRWLAASGDPGEARGGNHCYTPRSAASRQTLPVHPDIDRVLHTASEIQDRIATVAKEISERFGSEPLTVIGVLNGAVVFVADLIRHIDAPLELAFVSASSYGDGTTSGRLELDFLPAPSAIEGRRILLVDDILDTGRTMASLQAELLARGAREVHGCVLLDKPSRRVVDIDVEFVGFSIEDAFVVGFGLDYAGLYRNLPYIGVLPAEHASTPSA